MQLRRARGFALLEALLAMALFASAGLAALWSLQHTAQQQRQPLLQSTAMLLAQDLSERMFVNAHQTALYARTWQSQTPISASDCTQQLCTATALAAWDLQQWLDLVRKQLPQGDAQIQPMPRFVNAWSVTLAWKDERTQPINDEALPSCPAGLRCWQLVFSARL